MYKVFCSWQASRLTWYPQSRSIFSMSRGVTPSPRSVTSRRYRAPTAWWSMYNDGDDDDETTTKRWWWWWWSKSRSRICERNFNYETRWWWWWYVSVTDLLYILRSKNEMMVMMMIESRSQICEQSFTYERTWWWWWCVSITDLWYILRSKNE